MFAVRHFRMVICVAMIPALMASAGAAAQEPLRFSGDGTERTAAFEMEGPWLLDWTATSDTPLLANLEMRLHVGASGEFLGTIAQLQGTGRGLKLFEQGGSYAITVVASNVRWQLDVAPLNKAEAERLKRLSEGAGPTLEESSRRALERVPEGSFSSWRAENAETLLLFGEGGTGWRVTFARPCNGLVSASAISFVTPAAGTLDAYDSILLDDGTRCRFARAVPMVMD
jgi:hypothetical protein